jgi:hypothetical protein
MKTIAHERRRRKEEEMGGRVHNQISAPVPILDPFSLLIVHLLSILLDLMTF